MDTVELQHHQEFKQILASYQMSDRARKALEGLKFVLMVAATTTGRNTVLDHLLEDKEYYYIVSDTTRPPQLRDGKMEENGVNYFFRSEEDMLVDLKTGEFLEAALVHDQQVSGISIRELEKAKQLNKIAITDIEIVGADNVIRASTQAKAIFLIPPSFEEWRRRIKHRGNMSLQEIKNRLASAAKEFDAALEHDYYHFVIADDIQRSVKLIDAIAHGGINTDQDRGRSLVKQLHHTLISENS